MPVSLHTVTERRAAPVGDLAKYSIMRGYVSLHHGIQKSLSDLIMGGVLERFPKLKIVSVENDIGWIPHYMQRADHAWDRYRFLERDAAIPQPPSYYFRRQVSATFQDDRVGIVTRDIVGSRQPDVGFRLSAFGFDLAQFTRGHRARFRRRA